MIDFEQLKALEGLLTNPRRIVVTSHTNPDGDAVGSSLALMMVLRKLGHEVNLIIPNMYPGFLSWMPDIQNIIIFESHYKDARNILGDAELIFCLDFNSLKRSGVMVDDLVKATAIKVLIDHHPDPVTDEFNLIFSYVSISSTSELLFELLSALNHSALIDSAVASCLYVGIMTDTGSFSHAIFHADTFRNTAALLNTGINAEWIHRMIYDTFSENRLRLLGHAINNRMMVMEEYRTAIITLSRKDLKQFNYQIGDTEGVVNFPLSMASINMAVLLTEKKDHVRLSFRSKGSFSVNDFARMYFDGGGHRNAAGGNSELSLKDTVSRLIKLLPEVFNEINYQYNEL
jgi:bifunctional oligoribonuclease and PAP phosphatase NrnA